MTVVQIKDPDSVRDFTEDFTDILDEDDSIDTFSVEVISGTVVIDDSSEAEGVITARVSGGTDHGRARVRFRIDTVNGLRRDRTKHFYITQR